MLLVTILQLNHKSKKTYLFINRECKKNEETSLRMIPRLLLEKLNLHFAIKTY